MLNALPITQVLYQRGQFSAADSVRTAQVLTLYGIGILPTAVAIILMRCFYAVQDTVTPLVVEIIGLVYYVIAAPLLSRRYGLNGLAAARGGAFILVGLMLVAVLMKRDLLRLRQGRPGFYLRVTAATALMGVTSWAVLTLLAQRAGPDTTLVRLVVLGASGAASALVLIGVSRLLGIEESNRVLTAGLDTLATPFRRNGSSPGSQHG
jgi:putative peptidoglycan lipid II flippase